MSFTITLKEGSQYVGAALLSTVYLLVYQSITVIKHRRRSGIKYPQLYAEKAEQEKSMDAMRFNCAQRAHQNTLEYLPALYITTILSSLKFPCFAASACAAFVIGRIGYTRGYITGDPNKRRNPIERIGSLALIGQIFVATYVVGEAVLSPLISKFHSIA